jgi:hypothetical protein
MSLRRIFPAVPEGMLLCAAVVANCLRTVEQR